MNRIVEWLYRKLCRIKLHCYFHNFESLIWMHAMNLLWGMRRGNVQFTSSISQTVSVDVISVYTMRDAVWCWHHTMRDTVSCWHHTMRDTVSCRVYTYSMLSQLRIHFQWQKTGVRVSGNKCTFNIQCCLMRALQREFRHRSLFPVFFMIFWFWAVIPKLTILLRLFYKQYTKSNTYVCDRYPYQNSSPFLLHFFFVSIFEQHLTQLNFSAYIIVYIIFNKGSYFDKPCILEFLSTYAFHVSLVRNTSSYSISHAPVSDMVLQNPMN
jgi:hypothetical protein